MLFNSIEFLIFIPIVFTVYWFILNKSLTLQNLFIVIISYVFYGWWDFRFLGLMALTTLLSYLSGLLIKKFSSNRARQKLVSTLNVLINLGILGYYKYFNFFAESLEELLISIGYKPDWITLDIILPVGISFYTFQALSYSIDVFNKKIEPTRDIVSFFAYVSFFPQLVAGPIERATNLLPQFYKKRNFNYTDARDGLRQILWGFFKKMVIADNCSQIVNEIFSNYQNINSSGLFIGGVLFAFQIYGDFSGYSDIAIGLAKLFGIHIMNNFNFPYFSRNIAEFWKRWHISLTTWFRDYLYIPLGGSRLGKYITIRNTMIIFIVSGIWHGANWTFVIWGLYNALLFLPLLLVNKTKIHKESIAYNRFFPSLIEIVQVLFTFFLVVIGWIFFRSSSVDVAFDYISRIFSFEIFEIPHIPGSKKILFYSLFSIFFMLVFEWSCRTKQFGFDIKAIIRNRKVRWCVYILVIWLILELGGTQQSFIYFQF